MAIVLAMSVVALAALAAATMMVLQGTWVRQIELTVSHTQAQFVLQAGLDWGRAILSDDRRTSNVDHLGEPWAVRLSSIPIENGSLIGHLEDQQAKFNLNNLLKSGKVDPAQLENFRRLLSILALPPTLADAFADWIAAGGRPLVDVAELALVGGYDDDIRARLRPFVTALPRLTAVNVNTAAPEVLAAVVEDLDLDGARALVGQRDRAYFRSASEFSSRLPTGLTVSPENISVNSDYFMATMRVMIGGAQARGTALLAHDKTGGWPAVVWARYL